MSQNSTSSVDSQRKLRIQRMETLQARGINSYPVDSHRDYTIQDVVNKYEKLEGQKVSLCGFLKAKRGSGKIAFGVIADESWEEGFQIVLKADIVNPEEETKLNFKDFLKRIG